MRKYVTPEILTCVLMAEDIIQTSDARLSEETDSATNYGRLNRFINS